jgi:hypothetical protein
VQPIQPRRKVVRTEWIGSDALNAVYRGTDGPAESSHGQFDVRFTPQERIFRTPNAMSALGQKRTSAGVIRSPFSVVGSVLVTLLFLADATFTQHALDR